MLRFSRIILVLLVVAVMAFYLPGLFWKAFDQKVNSPLILYSVVQGEFVYRQSNEYGTVIYSDESGNEYDRIAYENLLPFHTRLPIGFLATFVLLRSTRLVITLSAAEMFPSAVRHPQSPPRIGPTSARPSRLAPTSFCQNLCVSQSY